MLAKVRLIFLVFKKSKFVFVEGGPGGKLAILCNCCYFTKCKHILQKLLSCKRGKEVYGVGGACSGVVVGDCQYTLQFN